MIPAAFVALPELPLTAQRQGGPPARLPEPGALPGAEPGGSAQEPPRTPAEELVAEIWRELLGRPEVGRGEDFFALGGHSLLATQVVDAVSEAAGVRIPVTTLFEAPTLAALAREVEAARGAWRPGSRRDSAGRPRVSRAGRRAAPATRCRSPSPSSASGSWTGSSPGADLQPAGGPAPHRAASTAGAGGGARRESCARHEALRTTFAGTEAGPAQVVAPQLVPALAVVDLAGLPAPARAAEARALAREEARRPFDLARGPLLRAALLRSGRDEHALLRDDCTTSSRDGWSIGRPGARRSRRSTRLRRRRAGAAAGAADPVRRLRRLAAAVAAGRGARGAARLLAATSSPARPAALDLPPDRPRPAARTLPRRRVLELALPRARRGRPPGGSRGARGRRCSWPCSPPSRPCSAASAASPTSRVGTPIANRNRPEIEGLIGFFVNTLVAAHRPRRRPDLPRAARARARETALGAYAHQDLPFEQLVEELQPERNLAMSPLFQVLLVLQNAPTSAVEIPGLRFEPMPADTGLGELRPHPAPGAAGGGGLAGALEYDADLFDRATCARLFSQFRVCSRAPRPIPAAGSRTCRCSRRRNGAAPASIGTDGVGLSAAGDAARAVRGAGGAAARCAARSPGKAASADLRRARPPGRAPGAPARARLGVGPEVPVALLARALAGD